MLVGSHTEWNRFQFECGGFWTSLLDVWHSNGPRRPMSCLPASKLGQNLDRRFGLRSVYKFTARWCNGSTADFDSACLGSSPSRVIFLDRFLCRRSLTVWVSIDPVVNGCSINRLPNFALALVISLRPSCDLQMCYLDSLVALDVYAGTDRRVTVRVGSAGSAEVVIALMLGCRHGFTWSFPSQRVGA